MWPLDDQVQGTLPGWQAGVQRFPDLEICFRVAVGCGFEP
jgi:hypothetical protein